MRANGNTVSENNRSNLAVIKMVRRRETVKLVGLKIVQQDESSRRNFQQINLKILLRTSMSKEMTMLIAMIIKTHPFNQSPKWSQMTSVYTAPKDCVRMAEFGSTVGKFVEQK
jgi:hypothetical protein